MDDDKKSQSQWNQSPAGPSGWQPADYPAEPATPETETPADKPAEASPAQPDQPVQADQPVQTPEWSWGAGPAAGTGHVAPSQPLPPNQPLPPTQPQGWGPPPNQPFSGWPPAQPAQPVQPAQPNQPWQNQGWPPAQPGQPDPWQPGQPWQSGQPGQPGPWQPGQPWQAPGQAPMPPVAPWPPRPSTFGPPAAARPSRLPQLLSVVAACLIAFSLGMVTDRVVFGPSTTAAAAPSAAPTVGANAPLKDFALYEQALEIIRKNYVGRSDVTDQQLLYGSIRGLVDSLGDTGHTVFLTPSEYQASQSQLSGSVAGIGVLLATDNGTFTVTKVLTGSPAQSGGVKAGDQITAVDGVSVAGLTFDVFASKIRGQVGTKVTITVVRAGAAEPINITMTRAVVNVPLVAWGMVPGTKIADIALVEFSQGASDQLTAAIDAATTAGAKGIVLDLRGNPGGYATEAVNVASEFISTGPVYLTEDAMGQRESNNVNTNISHTTLPMMVLVDHNSASASEIVAGALQDSKRAKIVGQSTFGTGTVLQAFKLNDGSAILLGTAYWLTPNGSKIFGKGITPDQQVALAVGVEPLDPTVLTTMTAAQLTTSGDAQLIAATKALTGAK